MCAQRGTRHRAAQNAQGKQPQMDTHRTGKPDLTRESSTEEGPGGGEEGAKARRASSRFRRLLSPSPPGRGVRGEGLLCSRVAPVQVRNGLAARRAADGVWCACANRVETTRLAGVATLPAPEHSAGAFLLRWLHCEVRLWPSLASLYRSTDADISQMPLGYSPPVVHCCRPTARGRLSPGAAKDGGRAPLCGLSDGRRPGDATSSLAQRSCGLHLRGGDV